MIVRKTYTKSLYNSLIKSRLLAEENYRFCQSFKDTAFTLIAEKRTRDLVHFIFYPAFWVDFFWEKSEKWEKALKKDNWTIYK